MRALLGLGGLLIGVFIILYAWSQSTSETVHSGSQMHDQVEQLSGRSSDGTPVNNILTQLENDERGQFKDLLVTDPGSATGGMQMFYGLKKGDRITSVENLTISELSTGDAMQQFLTDAYEKRQPIEVIRDGQKISLPLPSAPTSQPTTQNPIDKLIQTPTGAPQ